MSEVDGLAQALGATLAAAVRSAFADRNMSIDIDSSGWKAEGHSGAKLVAVVVERARANDPLPVRCIAKVCPPGAGTVESAQHEAALDHSYRTEFVAEHLVDIAFEPVSIPGGGVVMGQRIAGDDFTSMRMLAEVSAGQVGPVCREVRRGLLEHWTGPRFRQSRMTFPELLRIELRDGAGDWPVPAGVGWIITGEDGALPNPVALLDDSQLCAGPPEPWLIGYTHGDLHFKNVLVPVTTDDVVRANRYRLIDLSDFNEAAPLTRDLATLLLSILAHRVGSLSRAERNGLLQYLHAPDDPLPNVPADLIAVVDAVHDVGDAPFDSWRGLWRRQLRVSMMAEAVRHSTYLSVGLAGRWWCLRLAGLLALGEVAGRSPGGDGMYLTAETFAAAVKTGQTPGPPIIDQEDTRAELREAILQPRFPVILFHGAPGVGKSAIAGAVAAELQLRGTRVVERRATELERPDAMALLKILENDETGHGLVSEESVHIRLAAATDALDKPVVIIIDEADALLDGTHALIDAELDQAIDFVATEAGYWVTLVLVARKPPCSAYGCSWPRSARKVQARGLDQPHFGHLLSRLDPPGQPRPRPGPGADRHTARPARR